MKRVSILLVLLAGCGGKNGSLPLEIVVSPVDDPFLDATQVKFTIGDASHVKTVPVTAGHFNFSLEGAPISNPEPVIVEALDAAGHVVAHGRTPPLPLVAVDQQTVSVWVGRPGKVAAARDDLHAARSESASINIPGLGVLYAGGRGADGNPLASTRLYSIFFHKVIETSDMSLARAGAVAAPSNGVRAVVWGGASAMGTLASAELFDPTVGNGLWAAVPSDPIAPRAHPDVTVLGSGAALISGGVDDSGAPVGTAALVANQAMARVSAISGPMAAPRAGHAVAAAKFPDGDGALLFGGLAPGVSGPVAEKLIGQTFTAIDLPPNVENRTAATATQLASGDVLILGGRTAAGAQASGLVIAVGAASPGVTMLQQLLSTAREGHTTTRVGDDLLVCGGADASGKLQASCDLLDGTTLGLKQTVAMGTARRGHRADVLETGPVLLAGGTGDDGAPIASIEIYTP
jgi:hypothetical protein